jgi:hypothetical protein
MSPPAKRRSDNVPLHHDSPVIARAYPWNEGRIKKVFYSVRVGEMYRLALSVVELRFGAFYWVGILAEVSLDGEIAARFNLKAREVGPW